MLKTRVFTALVLLTFFGPIFFWLSAFDLYISFIVVLTLAAWEWGRILWPKNKPYPIIYAVLIFLSLSFTLFQHQYLASPIPSRMIDLFLDYSTWVAVLLWILVVPFVLKKGLSFPLNRFVTLFAIWGFFIFISTFSAAIVLRDQNRWLFLGVIALVWCADIGAYFVGKAFGRHKLAKNISPGKSWEGAIGGVVIVCLFIIACVQMNEVHRIPLFGWVLVGVFLAMVSVLGDLFESLLKRLVNIKDSSALLPGHGGVLDRIDAILPVLPISALLFKVLL